MDWNRFYPDPKPGDYESLVTLSLSLFFMVAIWLAIWVALPA